MNSSDEVIAKQYDNAQCIEKNIKNYEKANYDVKGKAQYHKTQIDTIKKLMKEIELNHNTI